MAPTLFYRNFKYPFVGPLEKAKPEKLGITGMSFCMGGCVFQKARAALLKNPGHRVRYESLGFDGQT
jgi:hypothetical protein